MQKQVKSFARRKHLIASIKSMSRSARWSISWYLSIQVSWFEFLSSLFLFLSFFLSTRWRLLVMHDKDANARNIEIKRIRVRNLVSLFSWQIFYFLLSIRRLFLFEDLYFHTQFLMFSYSFHYSFFNALCASFTSVFDRNDFIRQKEFQNSQDIQSF